MTKPFAIGIDVGGTNIRAAVVNRDGQIVSRAHRPTRADGDAWSPPDMLIAKMLDAAREAMAATGVTLDKVAGVGLGMGGQIARGSGVILGMALAQRDYDRFPMRERLQAAAGLPVWLDNDVKTAALGELHYGAGRALRDFVYLGIGTGVGGALVVNRAVVQGALGLAGHIGHMSVDWRGARGISGIPGCLEDYASGTAIARRARARGLASPDATHALTSEEVFARAERGDDAARAIVRESAEIIAVALASLIHLLNPQAIIVGGGVAQQPWLIALVREAIPNYTMRAFSSTPVLIAALGVDAGLIGAAHGAFSLDAG